MFVKALKSKIHRATVTEAKLDYPGSVAIDADLLEAVGSRGDPVGAVIISDYAKGVVTSALLEALTSSCIEKGVPLIVDPKKKDLTFYSGCTFITPNMKEAAEFSGVDIIDEDSLELAGRKIMDDASCKGVLITQGEDGMTLIREDSEPYHIASHAREVYDVTGAGDTVISTFSLALAAGLSEGDAVVLANIAAGMVVEKVGTAVVTMDELREEMRKPDVCR